MEFFADKVLYVDNAWDAVHTFIRPVGAALLGAALAGEELATLPAALGSGGLAFVSHATKATARAAVNTSPEPFSNIVVSLAEDGLVAALLWFAVNHPAIALVLVAVLTVAAVVLVAGLWKAARRTGHRVRVRFSRAT